MAQVEAPKETWRGKIQQDLEDLGEAVEDLGTNIENMIKRTYPVRLPTEDAEGQGKQGPEGRLSETENTIHNIMNRVIEIDRHVMDAIEELRI